MGPGPIGYTEIAAWAGLRGLRLTPWEVEALTALDHAWMAQQVRASQGRAPTG
jgi:hypothetical protein